MTSLELLNTILIIFVQNYNKVYTLEELTKIVSRNLNGYSLSAGQVSADMIYQAKVLEVLICLADINIIILNTATDESYFNMSIAN